MINKLLEANKGQIVRAKDEKGNEILVSSIKIRDIKIPEGCSIDFDEYSKSYFVFCDESYEGEYIDDGGEPCGSAWIEVEVLSLQNS